MGSPLIEEEPLSAWLERVGHHRDDESSSRRQSPRFSGSCRQSQGTDVQSGEEEEENGARQTSHSVQSSLRQRRRHLRQEEGTQLQQLKRGLSISRSLNDVLRPSGVKTYA